MQKIAYWIRKSSRLKILHPDSHMNADPNNALQYQMLSNFWGSLIKKRDKNQDPN
jgi:hypothetical protein